MTFIGDVHGKMYELKKLLHRLEEGAPTGPILQLGDMGLGFPKVELPNYNKDFGFIRGNHDNPSQCQMHWNYTHEHGMWKGVFVVGGAYSIDWQYRIPGKSWWFNEEQSIEALEDAYQLYIKLKPEIVASHEAPEKVGEALLTDGGFRPEKWGSTQSRTAVALQRMFSAHQPKLWVFGHYHRSWQRELEGTTFRCLNELEYAEVEL
jgi:predicted phosphodiesterase